MPRPEFYYDPKRKQYRKRIELNGVRRDVWADTKPALRARLDELKAQQAAGIVLDDQTTFADYAVRWLPLVTTGLTPSGRDDYEYAVNKWLLPLFGHRPLRDIKPLEVDELLKSMDGKSHSLRKKVLRAFRGMMDSAADNGLVLRNPALRKKPGGIPAAEKEPLTAAQQQALLSSLEGTRVLPLAALGLYAGLRREESLGLHWLNVHLDDPHPWLSVRHVVRYDRGKPILSDQLKSDAARREIPMPPQLCAILRAERALIQEGKRPASVLVIPDMSGGPCSSSAFRSLWAAVKRRAISGAPQAQDKAKHIPKKHRVLPTLDFSVTPHQLRHTYITALCASGLDIKKIQYLAGHSDPSVTLRIYAHVVGNKPEDLSAKINEVFSGGWGYGSGSEAPKSDVSSG